MPEITDAEFRQFVRYQNAGSPEEVERAVRKVPELEGDNKKYRDEIKDLKAKPGVQDDAVVLTGDEAKRWDAVKALGKTPEEIAAELEKGTQAAARLADMERRQNARKAAEAAGLNPDAYIALPGALGLSYEVRTEKVDGKDVSRAYVKGEDGKDAALSTDYVKARPEWAPLAAAVEVKAATEARTGGYTYAPDKREGGGKPAPAGGVDAVIEANRKAAEAPNALRPAAK